jgi:hypothetical protein
LLDVRLPIGALFFILGIMIAGWGYSTKPMGAIPTSFGQLPINFDIIWGILMTIFGLAMFSLAKLDEATSLEQALAEEKARAAQADVSVSAATSSDEKEKPES